MGLSRLSHYTTLTCRKPCKMLMVGVIPNIPDIFNEYARFCFGEFGDRVGLWLTINEPHEEALDAYGLGAFAPGIKEMEAGRYQGKCPAKVGSW